MVDDRHVDFDKYQAWSEKLAGLARSHRETLAFLKAGELVASVGALQDRIANQTFKVLVLGEFNRGKSTLINALLRQEVLPADPRPYTAIINEVKWGEFPRAVLHHRACNGNPRKPPIEVPIERLREYVAVNYDNGDVDAREAIHETPFERMEIFWPLDLCRNRVEIIDSPGLNSNDIHEKITMEYLPKVDAVVFVFSCEALGSKSEMFVIDSHLLRSGHEAGLFYVCNRFDQIRPRERESFVKYVRDLLADRQDGDSERVFFVCSRDALDGYLDSDARMVEQSGFVPLEAALKDFLFRETGRVKVLHSARELSELISTAQNLIPDQRKMLLTTRETLERRYGEAQQPLLELERQRGSLVGRVAQFFSDTQEMTGQRLRSYYRELDYLVPGWLQEYEIKQPFRLMSGDAIHPNKAIERVVSELTEHLSERMQRETDAWASQQLQPFVQSRIKILFQEMDEGARRFLSDLDRVRVNLVEGVQANGGFSVARTGEERSALERVLAAAGGLFVMDIGAAGMGWTFGVEAMAKNVALQLAIGIGAFMAGLTNPIGLLALLLGTSLIQALVKGNATNEKIKEAVGRSFCDHIHTKRDAWVDEQVNGVASRLEEIKDALDRGLGSEIQRLRAQVEAVLEEKRRDEAAVLSRISGLEKVERDTNLAAQQLKQLLVELARR